MLSNAYDRQSVFINRVIMSLSYMSGSVYEELLLHPNKITENILTFCQSKNLFIWFNYMNMCDLISLLSKISKEPVEYISWNFKLLRENLVNCVFMYIWGT